MNLRQIKFKPLAASVWMNVQKRKLLIIFAVIYLGLSVFAMLHFLKSSYLGDVFYRTKFEAMYHGTAWKPFVYRVLIPKTARAITEATPESWRNSINQKLYNIKSDEDFSRMRQVMPWLADVYKSPPKIYPRVVATLLIYACLWGFIIAIYKLAGSLFPGARAIQLFAPIFGLLLIPSFSWQFLYVYDIPVLFLSTACYYCMVEKKFKPYLVFFALACLNKESAVIILVFFALWFYSRLPTRLFITLWAAQCLIFATIKIFLTLIYYHNAGWFLEDNLGWVLNRDLLSRSGYMRILVIALIFFLLTNRWEQKPLFLKYSLWLLGFMFVPYLFYGFPGEYRVFFDILPLLVLLGTHTLIATTGIVHSPVFMVQERRP